MHFGAVEVIDTFENDRFLCVCQCGKLLPRGAASLRVASYTQSSCGCTFHLEKWTKDRDFCLNCKRDDVVHAAHGLCRLCYSGLKAHKEYERAPWDYGMYTEKTNDRTPRYEWSIRHECCVVCGTVECTHQAHGMCRNCWHKDFRVRKKKELEAHLKRELMNKTD